MIITFEVKSSIFEAIYSLIDYILKTALYHLKLVGSCFYSLLTK